MRSVLFAKIGLMLLISIIFGSMAEASDKYDDVYADQKIPTFVILVQGAIPSEKNFDLKYSLEFEGETVKELGVYSLSSLYMNPKPFDLESFSSPFLESVDQGLIHKITSIIDKIKKEQDLSTQKRLYNIIYK